MGRATTRRLLLAAALLRPASAGADELPPITDRDYALDLYQGAALGSVRIVGMGGANVALADGAAGIPGNPAAPAIRPATSNRKWDWDWNVDWLNPELGSDYDNNGQVATGVDRTSLFTGGLVGRYRSWAIGLSGGEQRFIVDDEGGRVDALTLVAKGAVAHTFASAGITGGFGVRTGNFSLGQVEGNVRTNALFAITGTGFEAGAVWHPSGRDLRVGASLSLPITGAKIQAESCDPMDCHGYILPERVVVPWQAAAGVAWRFAATPWNQTVAGRWRDERSLLLAADVVVTGRAPDGYGLEAFVDRTLQPSGRALSVSVRGGAEWESRPGWVRVRAGSYWEPGRFDGVSGRVHVTGGFDLRFWSFCFWSERYRARLSMTGDIAERYGNVGLSVGLWH
jgi:hypothetical protein